MRTCPACGKENENSVTRCATCDEEIGAGTAQSNEPEPHTETVRVDAEKVFAAASQARTEDEPKSDGKAADDAKKAEPATNHAASGDAAPEKPADEQEDAVVSAAHAGSGAGGDRVGSGVSGGETQRSSAQMTAQVPLEQMKAAGGPTFYPGAVKLVVEQGMSVNKEYLLNDPELVIGRRDPEQEFIPDIDLFDQENANNRYISRRQARLFFQEGHLFVEDLDSSNGTCVNNRPIKPNISVQLNPGDKLLLGQSVMFRIRPMAT